MKILLVDDHALLRGGVRAILAASFPRAEFCEASTAVAAFALLRKERFDVAFVDIGLPDHSGLEVLKQSRESQPKLPVLMLSMYPEDEFATRVLKAGAAGYLAKGGATAELIEAVKQVMGGQKYVSPALAQKMALDLAGGGEKSLHASLSEREYQVFCLLGSGKSVSEIAEELMLSVKTVSTHRVHILAKTDLKTNANITRYCLKNRLIE